MQTVGANNLLNAVHHNGGHSRRVNAVIISIRVRTKHPRHNGNSSEKQVRGNTRKVRKDTNHDARIPSTQAVSRRAVTGQFTVALVRDFHPVAVYVRRPIEAEARPMIAPDCIDCHEQCHEKADG